MSQAAEKWFAIMVKPRFEKSVSGLLRAKGYEEFTPVMRQRQAWSDRWKTVEFPLFPRYLFCRFDFQNRVPVLNTPGVVRVVGFGPTPCDISDPEIEALRIAVRVGVRLWHCDYLAYGEPIKVVNGPLAGTEGFVVETKSNTRVVLSVHLLQRSVYAEVDLSSTRRIDSGMPPARPAALEALVN
jgi:transcription antitermination factor NusG